MNNDSENFVFFFYFRKITHAKEYNGSTQVVLYPSKPEVHGRFQGSISGQNSAITIINAVYARYFISLNRVKAK